MVDGVRMSTGTQVVLVFPPLVETNFGNYYPSTAVLAGVLAGAGVVVDQVDLNEAFAVWLLRAEVLDRLAGGFSPSGDGQPAVQLAALLLRRCRSLLFDSEERHRFRQEAPGPAHLLGMAARGFAMDRDPSLDLDASLKDADGFYGQFFDWAGLAEGLLSTVRLVGISVAAGAQLIPALALAQRVKSARPDIRVVLGGPVFSLMDEHRLGVIVRGIDAVDVIVRFEGEYPLELLVKQGLAGSWQPEVVPGVSCRVGNAVVHVPARPGLRLDDLPFASYAPEILSALAQPDIGILQARGCYWGRCAYCDFVEMYPAGPRYRSRSAARAVEEVAHQLSLCNPWSVAIVTESMPPSFAREFSKRVLSRGLKFRWHSFAMAEPGFSRELLASMAEAGCSWLVVGIETMNDGQLERMNKRARSKDNIAFIRAAADAGIGLKVNIIPDFPSTTYADAMWSLELFDSVRDCIDHVAIYPFQPTRSSALGREPEAYGLLRLDPGQASTSYIANHLGNESNRLEVDDPAMTCDERKVVMAAYTEFARMINARREHAPPTEPVEALAVDVNELAWTVRDGTLHAYNARTRSLHELPGDWANLFEAVRVMGPITVDDLSRLVCSQTLGREIFEQAVRTNLFRHRDPRPAV